MVIQGGSLSLGETERIAFHSRFATYVGVIFTGTVILLMVDHAVSQIRPDYKMWLHGCWDYSALEGSFNSCTQEGKKLQQYLYPFTAVFLEVSTSRKWGVQRLIRLLCTLNASTVITPKQNLKPRVESLIIYVTRQESWYWMKV